VEAPEPATEPEEEVEAPEPATEPEEEVEAPEPATEPEEVEAQEPVSQEASQADKKVVVEADEKAESAKSEGNSEDDAELNVIQATATAYTANCDGCSGITSTGVDLNANPNAKVIAVDPSVIPLGSKVYVDGYGYAVAADTGGSIKGNKIDVHVPTKAEAYKWGNRTVNVTILK
ncbi:3D domain-containing protein, partial [Oceanobacillus caeni]|uniref:3D domain-containing protein n=1 Tax=Oceanobacillus caeni TaxID=405946 RepID=UPI002E1B4871|nr:3D domain-containing protein [Oceanobacillus caeni]